MLSKVGAGTLRAVIQTNVDRADAGRETPAAMVRQGRRPIWVRSLWGDFRIFRAYYTHRHGGCGTAPSDGLLGLYGPSYTPALAKILSKLAAQMPFESAAELLRDTTGTKVNGRQFHRLAGEVADSVRAWTARLKPGAERVDTLYVSFDGTGVPMRKEYLAGRKGRAPDGQAKTRELRLGCVFTQTGVDADGRPMRDSASTSYLSSLSCSKRFGREVRAEAVRRGMRSARQVVVVTDGALWCETAAAMNFPGRLHILDFFHAAEHVHDLAVAIFGDNHQAKEQSDAWRESLLRGQAAAIIQAAKSFQTEPRDAKTVDREIAYLTHNLKRMCYDQYRKAGLFIGSGVIEAGCKTVVGQRAKMSGMHWGERGVLDVLAIRCALLSGRMDAFWIDELTRLRAA